MLHGKATLLSLSLFLSFSALSVCLCVCLLCTYLIPSGENSLKLMVKNVKRVTDCVSSRWGNIFSCLFVECMGAKVTHMEQIRIYDKLPNTQVWIIKIIEKYIYVAQSDTNDILTVQSTVIQHTCIIYVDRCKHTYSHTYTDLHKYAHNYPCKQNIFCSGSHETSEHYHKYSVSTHGLKLTWPAGITCVSFQCSNCYWWRCWGWILIETLSPLTNKPEASYVNTVQHLRKGEKERN